MNADSPFHCARCGIKSHERSCFVIPERYGKPPHYVRCVTCEQKRIEPTSARALCTFVLVLFWPVYILVGSQRGSPGAISAWTVLLAGFLYPLAIIAHEVGHALTAWVLRLELGSVGIGYGRVLWRFGGRTLPVKIHAWPMSGRVYVGTRSVDLLRTRLWVTTLMGPMVNVLFVALTAHYWLDLEPIVGTPALGLWLIVNALLVVTSLVPHRGAEMGQHYRSDGLGLLEIPRAKTAELVPYLMAAPLMRSHSSYESDDFRASRDWAKVTLAREPGNKLALLMLTASLINLDEYGEAIAHLSPVVDGLTSEESGIRAALWNALAVALLLESGPWGVRQSELRRAEQLSRNAYDMYPCVLEYRATRALFLVATGHPQEALGLLEYCHYEKGTRRQQGHREAARAFAHQQLGDEVEAACSAERAVKLDPLNGKFLRSLGVSNFE